MASLLKCTLYLLIGLKGDFQLISSASFSNQIKKLKELRAMLMEQDPNVAVIVRKLVMVSLMEIFKDIVPSYRIRPLTEAEKATKVKYQVFISFLGF